MNSPHPQKETSLYDCAFPMFACFLFLTTVSFETIGQIQPYVMERSKPKDTGFQQVSRRQAAREWRDFYLEGMAEVGVQLLLANL